MPEGIAFVQIFDWVKNVSSFIVALTAIIAFIKPLRTWLVKKVRHWASADENRNRDEKIESMIDDLQAKLDTIIEQQEHMVVCDLDLLRSNINHMFFKYEPDQRLPIYEKENLIKMYESYARLGGNSYVKHLYLEMMKWAPCQRPQNV